MGWTRVLKVSLQIWVELWTKTMCNKIWILTTWGMLITTNNAISNRIKAQPTRHLWILTSLIILLLIWIVPLELLKLLGTHCKALYHPMNQLNPKKGNEGLHSWEIFKTKEMLCNLTMTNWLIAYRDLGKNRLKKFMLIRRSKEKDSLRCQLNNRKLPC